LAAGKDVATSRRLSSTTGDHIFILTNLFLGAYSDTNIVHLRVDDLPTGSKKVGYKPTNSHT